MEPLDKDTDGSSLNIVESNIEQLKALFPDIVSEGKINFEKLREALGDAMETQEERYNFSWNGKALAKRIAQTQSTGTLLPCKAESKHWDTTQNLFIEGDNLEVLKLLQKSYHKQVKMIYIDPPYNTGNEFIYPDNYQDNLDTYLQYTHQKDSEGRKFGTNADTSGRYHTNWLNMMYPRLKLARNLLRDDGVIFISIDDGEVANLRKLCDEVFGEENFVANIIWQKKYAASNDAKYLSDLHDHILLYCKTKNNWKPNLFKRPEELNAKYANPDNDPRGPWYSTNLSVKTYSAKNDYIITSPAGIKFSPPPSRCWVVSEDKYLELFTDNRIWFGRDGTSRPYKKGFLSEVQDGVVPTTIWSHQDAGHNIGAKTEIRDLFSDTTNLFDTPKPTKLILRLLELATSPNEESIILDFFGGSGTTADAILRCNIADNGNRKFIMVQLPEPIKESQYKTISDICKERIRRAGEKILKDNTTKDGIDNLDIGFKVFKLDSSNIKPWDADFDNLEDTLLNIVDNIKEDRSEDDVLTEILLKYGLDLTVPIEERQVSGKTVYIIGFGALVVCLADAITLEVVEGIGHLKAELAPEVMRVVFKDSGFKDDVVKTNAIQILKQYGIDDVKSL